MIARCPLRRSRETADDLSAALTSRLNRADPVRRPAGRHQIAHPDGTDPSRARCNAELIRLYWEIGGLLDARQAAEGWGAGVIPRLAQDIRNELPEIKGFSARNMDRMVAFARVWGGKTSRAS